MMASLPLHPHYDELMVSLEKIKALLGVVTSTDLTELKLTSIVNYFWVVHNVFTQVKTSCEYIDSSAVRTVFYAY